MQRLLRFLAALVVAAVVIPFTSFAQEPEPAETQAQRIEQLERRVEGLEQELQRALEALEALDRQPEIGQPTRPEAAVEEPPDEPQKEEAKAVHAKQPEFDIGGASCDSIMLCAILTTTVRPGGGFRVRHLSDRCGRRI